MLEHKHHLLIYKRLMMLQSVWQNLEKIPQGQKIKSLAISMVYIAFVQNFEPTMANI